MRKLVKWPRRATLFSLVACALLASWTVLGCKKRQSGPAFQAEDLAVGGAHACASMKDGSVRCWGKNDAGQLGDKTREDRARPVLVEGLPHATAIIAGPETSCALSETGAGAGAQVTCWGGDDTLVKAASSLHDVAELALGKDLACARSKGGTVACWASSGPPVFAPVAALEHVAGIAVGGHHACAVFEEVGVVRCWGKNDAGQLGDGTTTDRAEPVTVARLRGVVQMAAGEAHTCAVLSDRTVSCWGSNRHGQLGDGTHSDRATPASVVRLEAARAVALGDGHTCARLYDGTLRCWGQNDAGQQNDGTRTDRETPGMISGLFDVQQLALGEGTVCARLADGSLRCWGRNQHGQAGDGTRDERPVPVTVRW